MKYEATQEELGQDVHRSFYAKDDDEAVSKVGRMVRNGVFIRNSPVDIFRIPCNDLPAEQVTSLMITR